MHSPRGRQVKQQEEEEQSVWDRHDEVVEWVIVPPNTLRAVLMTERASPHYSYSLCVVPAASGTRNPSDATMTAVVGRVSPLNYVNLFDFPQVRPMATYHAAYREDGLWHWVTVTVPMQTIPYCIAPSEFCVHFLFDEHPDVQGIKAVVTANTGYRSERQATLDTMAISSDTGLPCLTLRNLSNGTAYTVAAWPMLADGSLGLAALPVKVCTRPKVEISVEALGDTFIMVRVGRPKRQGPTGRGVEEADCRVQECHIQLWEDPVPSLIRNANRISARRPLVHVPLQRRHINVPPMAEGEFTVHCISNLNPNTVHFMHVSARTDTYAFDEPVRSRFSTCRELRIIPGTLSMAPRGIAFAWEYPPGDVPIVFHRQVSYPSKADLFNEREEPFPYIGKKGVPLPDGSAWDKLVFHTSANVTQTEYQVLCRCTRTGDTVTGVFAQAAALIEQLKPNTAYEMRIRLVRRLEPGQAFDSPWSRPVLFMTPSEMLARVARRSSNSVTVAWGRHLPPPLQPLPLPLHCGVEYYPDPLDPTPPTASSGHYYYAEPLPFLPAAPTADDPGVSDDDDEVQARNWNDTVTVARWRRPVERPEPLVDLGIQIDEPVKEVSLAVARVAPEFAGKLQLTLHGISARDGMKDRIKQSLANLYQEDASSLEQRGALRIVDTMTLPAGDGVAEFSGLEPGTPYAVFFFESTAPQASLSPFATLRVATLTMDTYVGASFLPDNAVPVVQQEWVDEAQEEESDTDSQAGGQAGSDDVASNLEFSLLTPTAAGSPTRGNRDVLRDLVTSAPHSWATTIKDALYPCKNIKHDLRVVELSEVFVSVGVSQSHSNDGCPDVILDSMLLDLGVASWHISPVCGPGVGGSEQGTDIDGNSSFASLTSSNAARRQVVKPRRVQEYIVSVQRMDVAGDTVVPVGKPVSHYFCTWLNVVQVVNLFAAAQYELRVTRWDNARHDWTPWSPALSVTTVQRVLIEVEEMSPEYIKLRWGRRQKDDAIVEYILRLEDLVEGQDEAPSRREIPVRSTGYALRIAKELTGTCPVDASVVPRYANGQFGVPSNPVRLLSANIPCKAVEIGATHVLLQWRAVDLSDVTVIGKPQMLVRLRKGETWEQTLDAGVADNEVRLERLECGATYAACVTLLAVVSRGTSDVPLPVPSMTKIISDTTFVTPFSCRATTLALPVAHVSRVGDSCMEITYTVTVEPRASDVKRDYVVDIEVKLVDYRQDTQVFTASSSAKCAYQPESDTTTGTGRVFVAGLSPDRRYHVFVRQRYSKGNWGEWAKTVVAAPTLRRVEIRIAAVGDAFVQAVLERPPLGEKEFLEGGPLRRAQCIESSRFVFTLQGIGASDLHRRVESVSETIIFDDLEPITPVSIVGRAWDHFDWGDASPAVAVYTLPQLLPHVVKRSINRLEIGTSRDRRLPSVRTDLCIPHDDASALKVSSLVAYKISAVPISSTGVPLEQEPVVVHRDATEGTLATATCIVDDLLAAHPYLISVIGVYRNTCTSPKSTTLATITLNIPTVTVAHLGEDSITVTWAPSLTSVNQVGLLAAVQLGHRDASREGIEVETIRWDLRARVPLGTRSAKPAFQARDAKEALASALATAPLCTIRGLMPKTAYTISMRSVDQEVLDGGKDTAYLEIGTITTANFASLRVQKLAENFVEVAWIIDLASATSSFAFARRPSTRGSSGHSSARSVSTPMAKRAPGSPQRPASRPGIPATTPTHASHGLPPAAETTPMDEESDAKTPTSFEVVVFSEADIVSGRFLVDPTAGISRSAPYTSGRVLIDGLNPSTRYVALGRSAHIIDEEEVLGAWVEKLPFHTLSLLLLRVVAVGLNFVNVTWVDREDAPDNSDPSAHMRSITTEPAVAKKAAKPLLDVTLPAEFRGTSTFFCHMGASGAASAAAAAVQFQLRVLQADMGGEVRGLHQDLYVTNNATGIHTIVKLQPGTPYAVSMRVCYEGISGSWVEPCLLTTDPIPLARVAATSQNGASFGCVASTSKFPAGARAIAARKHRLYEVTVDDPTRPPKAVLLSIDTDCEFHVSHLRRDHYYNVFIREILNGEPCGDAHPLSAFWTQPYPPVITELTECRNGYAAIAWGVMDSNQIGTLLQGSQIPSDFVYSVERGYKKGNTTIGWREIAVTDQPNVRFKWEERQGDRLERHCFRVRLSKLFVTVPGSLSKVPVWGDYSAVVYWRTPAPPAVVLKLKLELVHDTAVVVGWRYPEGHETQPGLSFTVLIDAARQYEGLEPPTQEALISAARGPKSATGWYLVTSTTDLHCRIEGLIPNANYRVAVQCESRFGVSHDAAVITFTTRPVPNPDAATFNMNALPRSRPEVTGVPPYEPAKDTSNNLYDKYDIPKQRRLKTLAAMAGITDDTPQRGKLIFRFQMAAKRLIAIMRHVEKRAIEIALMPEFDPNGQTAMQIARDQLKQPINRREYRWWPQLFKDRRISAVGADMKLTLLASPTIPSPNQETPTNKRKHTRSFAEGSELSVRSTTSPTASAATASFFSHDNNTDNFEVVDAPPAIASAIAAKRTSPVSLVSRQDSSAPATSTKQDFGDVVLAASEMARGKSAAKDSIMSTSGTFAESPSIVEYSPQTAAIAPPTALRLVSRRVQDQVRRPSSEGAGRAVLPAIHVSRKPSVTSSSVASNPSTKSGGKKDSTRAPDAKPSKAATGGTKSTHGSGTPEAVTPRRTDTPPPCVVPKAKVDLPPPFRARSSMS